MACYGCEPSPLAVAAAHTVLKLANFIFRRLFRARQVLEPTTAFTDL
jgi:hypothetical protein